MLVSGAASGQDKLSQAAQSSAKTITQLTDVVKLGAASIGADDPETQVSRGGRDLVGVNTGTFGESFVMCCSHSSETSCTSKGPDVLKRTRVPLLPSDVDHSFPD